MDFNLISILLLLAFSMGVSLRIKNGKKFNRFVDPILILQAVYIILRFIPFIKFYGFFLFIVSILLAIVLSQLDREKPKKHKIYHLLILTPLLILYVAKMEHWWWASYIELVIPFAVLFFTFKLFKKADYISKELPYLILFFFEMLFISGQLIQTILFR